MVLSSLRPDANFVDFLESHARGESIKELVARTVGAFALVLGGFGPLPWGKPIVATLSVAYFSYAVWGLLDRARSYSIRAGWRATAQYLRILCGFFVAVGVVAGIGLIFAIGFALLGAPWIL
jgi:hypothetical protein